MNLIYFVIVALCLYGDLLKRALSPTAALGVQYIMALVILLGIVFIGGKKRKSIMQPICKKAKALKSCIFFLIIAYSFQFLLSLWSVSVLVGLSSALYVIIPLLFTGVILKHYPQFDLVKLIGIFFLLIIPVNVVGVIQYAINPDFLISSVYVESGGIISRNLGTGGSFLRFPSIFASADRYSAIGLMQFYFAFLLILTPDKDQKRKFFWLFFNLLSSIIVLFIAGARSRILIALAVTALTGAAFLQAPFARRSLKLLSRLGTSLIFLLVLCLVLAMFIPKTFDRLLTGFKEFPVVGFLIESLEKKENQGQSDVEGRIDQALERSFIPKDITLFGKGMGAEYQTESGLSKPGEFGIASMWTDNGLVGGSLMLGGFLRIILILVSMALKDFKRGQVSGVVIFILPSFVFVFGLLTGLTAILELSSGVLLMISVGVSMQLGTQVKQG